MSSGSSGWTRPLPAALKRKFHPRRRHDVGFALPVIGAYQQNRRRKKKRRRAQRLHGVFHIKTPCSASLIHNKSQEAGTCSLLQAALRASSASAGITQQHRSSRNLNRQTQRRLPFKSRHACAAAAAPQALFHCLCCNNAHTGRKALSGEIWCGSLCSKAVPPLKRPFLPRRFKKCRQEARRSLIPGAPSMPSVQKVNFNVL